MLARFSIVCVLCFVSPIFVFNSAHYDAVWWIDSVFEIRCMQISLFVLLFCGVSRDYDEFASICIGKIMINVIISSGNVRLHQELNKNIGSLGFLRRIYC